MGKESAAKSSATRHPPPASRRPAAAARQGSSCRAGCGHRVFSTASTSSRRGWSWFRAISVLARSSRILTASGAIASACGEAGHRRVAGRPHAAARPSAAAHQTECGIDLQRAVDLPFGGGGIVGGQRDAGRRQAAPRRLRRQPLGLGGGCRASVISFSPRCASAWVTNRGPASSGGRSSAAKSVSTSLKRPWAR